MEPLAKPLVLQLPKRFHIKIAFRYFDMKGFGAVLNESLMTRCVHEFFNFVEHDNNVLLVFRYYIWI
jgi:hypothetical protein